MKDINLSIRKLVSPDLRSSLISCLILIGNRFRPPLYLVRQEELKCKFFIILVLQGKAVLASAAQAYISAYDAALSNIEELKIVTIS